MNHYKTKEGGCFSTENALSPEAVKNSGVKLITEKAAAKIDADNRAMNARNEAALAAKRRARNAAIDKLLRA